MCIRRDRQFCAAAHRSARNLAVPAGGCIIEPHFTVTIDKGQSGGIGGHDVGGSVVGTASDDDRGSDLWARLTADTSSRGKVPMAYYSHLICFFWNVSAGEGEQGTSILGKSTETNSPELPFLHLFFGTDERFAQGLLGRPNAMSYDIGSAYAERARSKGIFR